MAIFTVNDDSDIKLPASLCGKIQFRFLYLLAYHTDPFSTAEILIDLSAATIGPGCNCFKPIVQAKG